MEIRAYQPTDADALWELKRGYERERSTVDGADADPDRKLTPAYRHRYLGWVSRCAAADPDCVAVAAPGDSDDPHLDPDPDADDLLGYALVLPQSLAMLRDAAVLSELYVPPAHRGAGVRDELLAAALDVARRQDLPVDRLVLDVAPVNDRARGFYRRHGFVDRGDLLGLEL